MSELKPIKIRQPAANQLLEHAKKIEHEDRESATTNSGNPISYKDATLTVGKKGTTLFQDWVLIDELAHFSRERIPERVVHAKGAGAFGYFEVTHDITQYTAAKVFAHVGKKTPIAVRFSQVAGEMGYPDTVRDIRGFAVKFYTEDGIWDLVGNNTPLFFVRDCALFPSFIHILKRNPVTHLRPDYDMFWDFISLRPESTHQTLVFFSDRGIPSSYRHMHGYGADTFGFVNEFGQFFYCKFHYLTDQGIGTLGSARATEIAGQDPDFLIRDLYNAIATGNYPTWSFYIQIMTPEQAEKHPWDPFDVTKVWLHADFPLIPVGKLVLNRNPKNYFAEVEQMAFDPAHLIPGIEPSPDRMLQGRLFNYGDTARYRLGANNLQLPVNSPFKLHNFSRDGFATLDSQGGAPNYHPNSFGGPDNDKRALALSPLLPVVGNAGRYDNGGEDWDNFGQARLLYHRVLKEDEKERLVDNIVNWLKNAADFLQERAIRNFANVDEEFARKIRERIQAQVKPVALAEL
ncbi:catalase [Tribolium castaneum]|uniref:Catalase-like Protein n=1 Tax=Tribolium castaneum TaxID=7070 RepID=D6X4D0_TRICA|nr:PREDICTED: catalase [Tribolium castaneum]EEZ97738.1 Catalase-like Protein [Tribolium castaneum]|eukprot:XP_970103.1 PREDICTED: catalase [Tribolium castaneum]